MYSWNSSVYGEICCDVLVTFMVVIVYHLCPNCTHLDEGWSCSTMIYKPLTQIYGTGQLKCEGKRAKTRFRLLAKRTIPFKSPGASVQSTTGSRGVRVSGSNGSNAGCTVFRGSVKSTGYPLHSPVSPSLSLPCVTVCHQISTGVYIGIEEVLLCPTLRETKWRT